MLTGLYNRATMKEKVMSALEQCRGRQCALLIIDIDDLKRINNTNGHDAGDEVIRAVANIAKDQFSSPAVMGRAGGDDFSVFISDMESKSVLISVLTKLQRTVEATAVANVSTVLGISIGVAMITAGECSIDEIYRRADEAMHGVKNRGKN